MIANRLGDPTHFVGTDLRWATRNRLGQERILSAFGELGEPAKNRACAQAERGRYRCHRCTFTHGFDGLLAHDLERVMIQLATV